MAVSNWAIIENGVVVNVVLWDGEGDIFDGLDMVDLPADSPVSVGFTTTDNGVTFTPPVAPPNPVV